MWNTLAMPALEIFQLIFVFVFCRQFRWKSLIGYVRACKPVIMLEDSVFGTRSFAKVSLELPTFEFLDRAAADLGVSVQLGNALNVNKINLPPANSANPCYPSKVEKGGKEKKYWNRKWIEGRLKSSLIVFSVSMSRLIVFSTISNPAIPLQAFIIMVH